MVQWFPERHGLRASHATPGCHIPGFRYIVTLKYIEYGFGYIIMRSLYTPYSIYLRGTISLKSGFGFGSFYLRDTEAAFVKT